MNLTLLVNSLSLAFAATALALVLGWAAALFALGSPRSSRTALVVTAIAVLALPPFLGVNAWLSLFGAGMPLDGWLPFQVLSLPTAIVVLGLMFWPIPFLLTLGAWQRVPSELLESEPMLRGFPLLRWLLFPAGRAAAGMAAAITFVLALNQFSVPAIFQVNVYPAEIWIRFNAGLDALGALKSSWPMMLASALLLIWAWHREVPWPRFANGLQPRLLRERTGPWPLAAAAGATFLTLALSLVLPLAELIISPRTWSEMAPAFQAGGRALVHTAWSASVTATVVVGLALVSAHHRALASSWFLFFMPGVVLGVGLILAFNRPPFLALYQSVWIVVLAWTLRNLGPAWSVVRHALRSMDPRLHDVARLEGATAWDRFRLIIWPQTGLLLGAAWYLVYLLCLWDTESLVLIMPPGGETLSLRIFNLLHYGHNAQINALCLILLALALVPLALWGSVRWLRSVPQPAARLGLCLVLGCCGVSLVGCTPTDSSASTLKSRLFSSARVIGSRGSGPGQFQKPRSVAVDGSDNLYVVDMTGRVQRFSAEGVYSGFWQMPQTDLGKPKGMCRDNQGRIIVIEPHYAQVNHFTTNGTLVEQWGEKGTQPGQLDFPRAVAAAPDGRLYISEYMRVERVQVFSPDRTVLQVIGAAGSEPGRFNRPEGIALDRQGKIYVADSCNHRVQIFAADGSFESAHGSPGSGPGEMSYPYDVVVDAEGRQYVCEFGNSRIQVFDHQGQWLETIGGPGFAPGQFSNPWSLALDSRGNLYVADALNHRVQKLIRRPVQT